MQLVIKNLTKVRKLCCFFTLFVSIYSCFTQKKISVKFLDDYVIKNTTVFKNTLIGGLSGVDFFENNYFFVVDDAELPRFLKATIAVKNNKILGINFKDVIFFKDTTTFFYKENILDLESIFIDKKQNKIIFTSEGSIKLNKKPTVFATDFSGKFIEEYQLPANLKNLKNIHHNSVLEGACNSIDNKGFWVIMEAPLISDENPSHKKQPLQVRLTYFDAVSKIATKQFAYPIDKIGKPSKSNLNINGVTAVLEYQKNHFFIVERAFQEGYGNTIRIFDAVIDANTTDVIALEGLKNRQFTSLKKTLLLDFKTIKLHLTEGTIDNIEGITFGPVLENGNQSLLLVADDNFQIYGKQLNQIILLEIVKE